MFCPHCHSEFLSHIIDCANCEVALVTELPTDPFASEENMSVMLEDKELVPVVVGAFADMKEGQQVLVEGGVASMIAGEAAPSRVDPGMHERFFLMVDKEKLSDVASLFRERWEKGLALEGAEGETVFADGDVILGSNNISQIGAVPVEEISVDLCPACAGPMEQDQEECGDCGLWVGSGA